MKKTRKYLLCLQVTCSKLLQLSKSWSNFISDRRIIWRLLSTHYLTQRQTEHDIDNLNDRRISTHYLTQRQTLSRSSIRSAFQYFNSLPHAEVDKMSGIFTTISNISTHYLTQRQTVFEDVDMTDDVFQLTTSRRGRLYLCYNKNHHFLFQLTTSRRGRRHCSASVSYLQYISTHYLTQRQTKETKDSLLTLKYFNSLPHAEVDKACCFCASCT